MLEECHLLNVVQQPGIFADPGMRTKTEPNADCDSPWLIERTPRGGAGCGITNKKTGLLDDEERRRVPVHCHKPLAVIMWSKQPARVRLMSCFFSSARGELFAFRHCICDRKLPANVNTRIHTCTVFTLQHPVTSFTWGWLWAHFFSFATPSHAELRLLPRLHEQVRRFACWLRILRQPARSFIRKIAMKSCDQMEITYTHTHRPSAG